MGDSASSLLRSGAISAKQADKHKLSVLKKTKVERDNEEPFHGKQGLKDQGGYKDKGHKNFRVSHLDNDDLTDIGSPERASGAPSKGGRVNSYGAPGSSEISDRKNQKPFFPKSAGLSTKASRGGEVDTGGDGGSRNPMASGTKSIDKRVSPAKGSSNKFAKKKPAKQGSLYGGGSRDTQ